MVTTTITTTTMGVMVEELEEAMVEVTVEKETAVITTITTTEIATIITITMEEWKVRDSRKMLSLIGRASGGISTKSWI